MSSAPQTPSESSALAAEAGGPRPSQPNDAASAARPLSHPGRIRALLDWISQAVSPEPHTGRRRRLGLLAHGATAALIIGVFIFACSGLISHESLPLNGDEIDTAWIFSQRQFQTAAKPWDWGSSHSGMYNLTFWLRALPYSTPWFMDNADAWNRIYGLGWTAIMLAVMYGFGAWALGRDYGLIVLFIAAFAHYNYFLATEGNYLNETSAVYLAAIWAFLAAERIRPWPLKLLLGLVCAGLFWAAFLLYFSGRIALVGVAAYSAMRFIMSRRWLRRNWLVLAAILAVWVPWALEVRSDMKADPNLVKYRLTGGQLLYKKNLEIAMRDYKTESAIRAVVENTRRAFMGFARGPNNYHSYQSPAHGFLDPVSLWLGIAGLALAVWRWRQPAMLALLLFFVMNNVVYGGLTVLPYPPKHQRVHFAIELGYFFVALPVWGLTRFPHRWLAGIPRAVLHAAAVGVCAYLGFLNSTIFWNRTWNPRDPYLKTVRQNMAMADFIEQNRFRYEFIVHNEGHAQWAYNSAWCNFNPWMRQPGFRLEPWLNAKKRPEPAKPTDPSKRVLFLIQWPIGRAVEKEIEKAAPGGRWMKMTTDGQPHFRVYIPPERDHAAGSVRAPAPAPAARIPPGPAPPTMRPPPPSHTPPPALWHTPGPAPASPTSPTP